MARIGFGPADFEVAAGDAERQLQIVRPLGQLAAQPLQFPSPGIGRRQRQPLQHLIGIGGNKRRRQRRAGDAQ
jgi:hypothetical protein